MIFGYARVSSSGQNLDAQLQALTEAGCAVVVQEKASGADRNRPELVKLLAHLKPGDTLVVTRLDRLGRSLRDLLDILEQLTAAEVGFKSLREPWAETTTPAGRMLTTVFGGLAQFERELIQERATEGRADARRRGVHLGRRCKLTPYQREEIRERLAAGDSIASLARSYEVGVATIDRVKKRKEWWDK